jgi:hypothetical protein
MTMYWQRLWQWLNRATTGSQARPAPRRRARLTVELLEARAVPANFTAATVTDLIADINAANQTAEADTITLAPGKTFTLTAPAGSTGSAGLPNITATGALTIVGNGDVIERSTAKGTPAFNLINVALGASLTLQNLTLQGGLAYHYGGAVVNQGSLTLSGVTVQNNTVQGYQNDPSNSFVIDGNASGGGIYSSGTLVVQGSTIRNNLAVGGPGAYLSPGGNAYGGGIYIAGGTATLQGTTVTGNTAKGGPAGPGSYNTYSNRGGPIRFPDGSGYGGGLYIYSGALTYLDAYTVAHVKSNKSSSYLPDIAGAYTLLP